MRRTLEPIQSSKTGRLRWAAFLVIFLAGVAEALAQETRPVAARVPADGPNPGRRIVVSIPDRQLALVEDGRVVKVYPIAVGTKATPSPAGEFKIANRITDPTYYAPGVVIGPGPENPLGTRWIGLSLKGLGIHGTNDPRSIGRRASHGCIRMRQSDLEELFELVRTGDAVVLHATRTVEVAAIFATPQAPAQAASAAQPANLPVVAAAITPQ